MLGMAEGEIATPDPEFSYTPTPTPNPTPISKGIYRLYSVHPKTLYGNVKTIYAYKVTSISNKSINPYNVKVLVPKR
jgi:hypothetical protein